MPLGYIRMSVVRDENGQLLDYKITDVNKACSRFFARPAETYIGVLASEIYPDFSSQLLFLKEVLDNTIQGKDIFFPQTELYTHWIVYSPEKDEVVGLFTDLTEAVKTNRHWTVVRSFLRVSLPISRQEWKSMIRMDSLD